jgi:beta-galactosidase
VKLDVHIDRETINANGQDIAFIEITLTDRRGNFRHNFRKKVAVTVERIGELIGFGSTDPALDENYFDAERTVFDGRALAVIRPGEAGIIRLTVKIKDNEHAGGCESVARAITVVMPRQTNL